MNHLPRFSSAAAAITCALSVSAADASGRDSLADRSAGANVFRSERRAAARDDGRAARMGHGRLEYAAPVERSPFDTPDTRPLRVTGDALVAPMPSVEHEPDFELPSNRVALGAGGSDSFGRTVPGYEQRAENWNEYLRANGSRPAGSGGGYAQQRPYDAPRGPHGAPNPFDPSVPQPETRTFYDNGAGTKCKATGGAGTWRSSCNIGW
ncbi:hypothetical protein BLA39750_02460 [Burkholderia lata]|uniref:Lipoprotein n=1 Tax=Burkholderia lata (strain ATCC 17760 / DSM 23089 / LMG 22485 / NCIMB 9086 / R18194 / 383) TaxID=482957 RepID=A0A6P2WSA4_BURL3|nr:hypothetical protein [Burkholderia lata]VWC99526.1 hypothetical protein BLA39750_02460 [Burkholderia lata]